jgi:hypothetical protein
MKALLEIWFLFIVPAYIAFKVKRGNRPVLSALFWPVVVVVLLVASRTSSSTKQPTVDPPSSDSIERKKYGLIDTAERDE